MQDPLHRLVDEGLQLTAINNTRASYNSYDQLKIGTLERSNVMKHIASKRSHKNLGDQAWRGAKQPSKCPKDMRNGSLTRQRASLLPSTQSVFTNFNATRATICYSMSKTILKESGQVPMKKVPN